MHNLPLPSHTNDKIEEGYTPEALDVFRETVKHDLEFDYVPEPFGGNTGLLVKDQTTRGKKRVSPLSNELRNHLEQGPPSADDLLKIVRDECRKAESYLHASHEELYPAILEEVIAARVDYWDHVAYESGEKEHLTKHEKVAKAIAGGKEVRSTLRSLMAEGVRKLQAKFDDQLFMRLGQEVSEDEKGAQDLAELTLDELRRYPSELREVLGALWMLSHGKGGDVFRADILEDVLRLYAGTKDFSGEILEKRDELAKTHKSDSSASKSARGYMRTKKDFFHLNS